MLRVGLTGGIASGKTAVSDRLGDLGAVIIDADRLAREVVEPGTTGLTSIIERFGDRVVTDAGLDRAALARIVFADPAARRDLERIIHPAVRARAAEIESQADPASIVVHVIPLLVETGQQDSFQVRVVVDADPASQLERLLARNAMTSEEAAARIAAQASREDRLAIADYVIDNTGTVTELQDQIDDLWAHLTSVD
jgi:dephospho-CoA kinase